MKLLPLLCVCLVSRSGGTFAAGNGPAELIVVEEGGDVVLPCSLSSKVDISSALFDWKNVALKDQRHNEVFLYDNNVHYNNGRPGQSEQFRGRVSHFPEELKHGNASIIIRNTKVADSGNYTCDFPRLQPRQRFHIELVVGAVLRDRRNESIPGAAPEPYIKILDETKDWSLLQCVVRGASPKPHVEWQDSSGNILPAKDPQVTERGGSYDIILQTTVTKSDHYYCVATQESIKHQIRADTYVHIGGAAPVVAILDATKDWSLLQCVVRGASPKPHVEWQDSSGNILPAKEPQVSERGGSYDIILQTTVTKSDHYYCVATQETINHQTRADTYVPIGGAAQKPSITTLDQTKDWSLLQCEVLGVSPKPHVEWQDSSGNILPAKEPQVSERGGSYDIILQTTVTKSDQYYCVATQQTINHQIRAETYVHIGGFPTVAVVVTFLCALLVVGVVVIVLVSKGFRCQRGSTAVSLKDQSHSEQLTDAQVV